MSKETKEYFKNLDKRTREYKAWKLDKETIEDQRDKKMGLGDYAAKVFEYIGIKGMVKFIAGEDCGCEERRERLNNLGKWFTQTKVKCLTKDEYVWLDGYFKEKKGSVISPYVQGQLLRIFNRVFTQRRQMSTCSPCVKELVDKLELLYNNYLNETEETNNTTEA